MTVEKWITSCANYSCIQNTNGNCITYSIRLKGKERPNITNCEDYIPMDVQ